MTKYENTFNKKIKIGLNWKCSSILLILILSSQIKKVENAKTKENTFFFLNTFYRSVFLYELILLIPTDITRSEMITNGNIYLQTDGVAMGSPLGPVLAGIFMVHLQRSLIPVLKDQLSFLKQYIDDTITFIKTGSAEYVLLILNSCHPNVESTYEIEVNSKLAFLDVFFLREGQNIITTVYRKVTNSDIYLNWNSFCPQS